MITDEILRDRCRGSLVGGAAGDALGYPVEFDRYDSILARYGARGITGYDLSSPWAHGSHTQALISDDTQMTLYTVYGLLAAEMGNTSITARVCNAYLHWFGKQTGHKVKGASCWLAGIPSLNQRRAPGNTCLTSLNAICNGKEPVNNSKGCGAVMRIAPVGIFGAIHGWPFDKTAEMAAEIGDLTHQHPMSKYSCSLMAVLMQMCMERDSADKPAEWLPDAVGEALGVTRNAYREENAFPEFEQLVKRAVGLRDSQRTDNELIEDCLGEGWVAEETLAIAIFSVLRHVDSIVDCLICAVNHGGDSDSTGAVAGNIIGALFGYDAIPAKLLQALELHDLTVSLADDLAALSHEEQMKERYINHRPYNINSEYLH